MVKLFSKIKKVKKDLEWDVEVNFIIVYNKVF